MWPREAWPRSLKGGGSSGQAGEGVVHDKPAHTQRPGQTEGLDWGPNVILGLISLSVSWFFPPFPSIISPLSFGLY
jgi:hypothetical protein